MAIVTQIVDCQHRQSYNWKYRLLKESFLCILIGVYLRQSAAIHTIGCFETTIIPVVAPRVGEPELVVAADFAQRDTGRNTRR